MIQSVNPSEGVSDEKPIDVLFESVFLVCREIVNF